MTRTNRKLVFTKRALDAIPPNDPDSPSREVEYSDQECCGLRLRVSKGAGKKYFQFRYNFQQRKYCISIGSYSAIPILTAREICNGYKVMLAKGINPAEERAKVANDQISFQDFLVQYLEFVKHLRSYQTQKYQLEKFVRLYPAVAKLPLTAITTKTLDLVYVKEKDRTSISNAGHLIANIHTMMNLAIKWKHLAENPCTGVTKCRPLPLRERYLSKEELPRFLKAVSLENDTLSKAAILLLLFTGCRRNEVLSMKYHQFKLDEGRIYLPLTKNGKSRAIILNEKALNVLQELSVRKNDTDRTRNSDYVFPARQGTKNRGYIFDLRKTLANICAVARIENFHCHDIRHTYASLAVSSGADLYAVQRLLGHSDISMTQRYAHLSSHDLRIATQGVAELIEHVTTGHIHQHPFVAA